MITIRLFPSEREKLTELQSAAKKRNFNVTQRQIFLAGIKTVKKQLKKIIGEFEHDQN